MPVKPSTLLYTVLLAGLSALPPLSIDMSLPAVPLIEAAYGVEPGRGVLTLSLFLLGFSTAPMLGGPLTDRFGRRATLLASLAINAVAGFACFAAPDFTALLAARLLQGAAAGVCLVVPLAIVRDTLDGAEARRQISHIMTVVGLAPLLAPMLGSWVLAFGSWRVIFAVQAVFGLGMVLFVLFGLAETLPKDRRVPLKPGQIARGYRAVFSNRTFLGFALSYAFSFGCLFAYISGSPGVFIGTLGLSEQAFSLAFACTSCGLILGAWTSGRMSHKDKSPKSIVLFCMVALGAAATGVLGVSLAGSVHTYTILPLVCVVTFCFGLSGPSATHKAVEPLPQVAGSASGALNALRMLVGSISSAVVTFFAVFSSPATAMGLAMAVFAALALALFWALLRRDSAGDAR